MSRESWVEITRRRAVEQQIRAAMAAEMVRQLTEVAVQRNSFSEFGEGLTAGLELGAAHAQRMARWESSKARLYYDSYLSALASDAAMPPAWKAA